MFSGSEFRLSAGEVVRIAVAADVDPRTVRSELRVLAAGGPARGRARARVREALVRLSLEPSPIQMAAALVVVGGVAA
jgi:hypothetical protein